MGKLVASLKAEHSPTLQPIDSTRRDVLGKNAYVGPPNDRPTKVLLRNSQNLETTQTPFNNSTGKYREEYSHSTGNEQTTATHSVLMSQS